MNCPECDANNWVIQDIELKDIKDDGELVLESSKFVCGSCGYERT